MPTKTNKQLGYLTKEEVLEFQELVREVYGVELSFEQAFDQGKRLIMAFEAIAKMPLEVTQKRS